MSFWTYNCWFIFNCFQVYIINISTIQGTIDLYSSLSMPLILSSFVFSTYVSKVLNHYLDTQLRVRRFLISAQQLASQLGNISKNHCVENMKAKLETLNVMFCLKLTQYASVAPAKLLLPVSQAYGSKTCGFFNEDEYVDMCEHLGKECLEIKFLQYYGKLLHMCLADTLDTQATRQAWLLFSFWQREDLEVLLLAQTRTGIPISYHLLIEVVVFQIMLCGGYICGTVITNLIDEPISNKIYVIFVSTISFITLNFVVQGLLFMCEEMEDPFNGGDAIDVDAKSVCTEFCDYSKVVLQTFIQDNAHYSVDLYTTPII